MPLECCAFGNMGGGILLNLRDYDYNATIKLDDSYILYKDLMNLSLMAKIVLSMSLVGGPGARGQITKHTQAILGKELTTILLVTAANNPWH